MASFKEQALAIGRIRSTEDFTRLVIGFKRVANIVGETPHPKPAAAALFVESEETTLHQALGKLRDDLDAALSSQSFEAALLALVNMGAPIDRFFDAVLVNCEEEALRNNRHALLAEIKRQFLRVADISKIVIETETGA